MRQVPKYLLIGNGRLAQHLQHYFSLLGLNYTTWHRGEPLEILATRQAAVSHILLLISDQAIEPFIEAHLPATKALKLHCSGSLITNKAIGVHPLMTFSRHLYPSEFYPSIPFVIDEQALYFSHLLPGLPNPHACLNTALKAKYHALCVLSANFSCLLWQKLYASFKEDFALPADFIQPYLKRQTDNLCLDPESALTGPLTRNDAITLEKNLLALTDDPFQEVYQSFIACYQKIKEKNGHDDFGL